MPWPLIKLMPRKTNFKFVRFAKVAVFISVVSLLATIGSLFTGGYRENPVTIYEAASGGPLDRMGAVLARGFNLGIDFKGGTLLELTAPEEIDIGRVRAGLDAMALGDVQILSFGDARHALVRFQPVTANPAGEVELVKVRVAELIPAVAFTRTEVVGPKVSSELFTSGVLALGAAIVMILIYIWFRFELRFGMGAVLALFHDTFLTLGLFSIFRIDFTLTIIAAVLTIIGYSMNDTVVVFDRLRENLRKYKRMPLADVIDLSTNETLSRTLITSVTALIAAGALLVLGGPTLEGFAIAMIFGILVGTYSSIYIAAPALLLWGEKRGEGEGAPTAKAAPARRTGEAAG